MTNYIAAMVDELYQLGVREVVISPGSRSTPLAVLFCEHEFQVFVSLDERSAGFFALGIAKEKERPVVLVCTSGSAVANYFPAIVEARHSNVPLIVLTADRPHELRQVGAPQTIDQIKFYHGYAKYFEELALPEETGSMYGYVRGVMRKAYLASMTKSYGVAHINIPLREPLSPDLAKLDFTRGRLNHPFTWQEGEKVLAPEDSTFQDKKGIIICGGDAYADYQQEVLQLAEYLKAPLLADPLSNFRNYEHPLIIDSYDAFLKSNAIRQELKPEFIIHFGQTPVSKRLQQFLAQHQDAVYWQVNETFQYNDPSLSLKRYVLASPKAFAQSKNGYLKSRYSNSQNLKSQDLKNEYIASWQYYQNCMRRRLNSVLKEERLFEGKLVQLLQEILPSDSRLFVANSMAIRDVDYFFSSRQQKIKILCNRGANGIDGTISTALGVSAGDHPTVLLTGDLAFIHDLNGLLIGKNHHLDLTIIILNNNGGGIFNYLPQKDSKYFDFLFLTPHGLDFGGLQTLYGLTYYEPEDYPGFEKALEEALRLKGIKLINVKIDADLSKALHDHYTTPVF